MTTIFIRPDLVLPARAGVGLTHSKTLGAVVCAPRASGGRPAELAREVEAMGLSLIHI